MTPAEAVLVERAKALSEKATPGPWAQPGANLFRVIALDKGNPIRGIVEAPSEHFYFGRTDLMTYGEDSQCFDDRAFIAASRTLVPELAALVESLSAERDRLRAVVEAAVGARKTQLAVVQGRPYRDGWNFASGIDPILLERTDANAEAHRELERVVDLYIAALDARKEN